MFTKGDYTSDSLFVKPPLPKRITDRLNKELDDKPYKSKRKADELDAGSEDKPPKSSKRTAVEKNSDLEQNRNMILKN